VPTRFIMTFQMATSPVNTEDANVHSGGWSEGFWITAAILTDPQRQRILNARRALLPRQAAIVAYKYALYTIAGNKLLPTGTSTTDVGLPGNVGYTTDIPQMALECSGQSLGSANGARWKLACIPDSQVQNGEFQPTNPYKNLLTQYFNQVKSGQFGFIGRDMQQDSSRVNNIAANVVTLEAAVGGVVGVDYLRFHRVKQKGGLPVSGSFLITGIVGKEYTLQGLPQITWDKPNGFARLDKIKYYQFSSADFARIGTRKIGAPFERYRGRRSKRRAG
jgi:hypothetical protein